MCRFAYKSRKSEFMRTLATLSMEPVYKSNKDTIHHAFGLVRHYIGRLGHHFRAADALSSCAPSLSEVLDGFEVRSIPTPAKSVLPPVDGMTRLESIIVRMLPNKSPDLDRYQRALTEMDAKYQLSDRFLENYADENLRPRVHAEIQVLERFFDSKLSFAADDPFIACSKPACFCCLLYFRHHPGHFVEPMSHRKIYLNWRPPDLTTEDDVLSQNRQRDILNAMTRDIRREALQQIDQKVAPEAWHPDSLTGITESVLHEPWEELKETTEPPPAVEDPIPFSEHLTGSEEKLTSPNADVTSFSSDLPNRTQYEKSSQPDYYSVQEDSDDEGGVPL